MGRVQTEVGFTGFIVVLSAFVTLSQFAPGFINRQVQVVPALRIVVAVVHTPAKKTYSICILFAHTTMNRAETSEDNSSLNTFQ